jgi:Fe-S oxidoreductase/CheY-like chemotaxis protein
MELTKKQLDSEKIRTFLEGFETKINRNFALSNSVCVHCGMCVDSCHYHEATGDPKQSPVYKADKIRKIYKSRHDWLSQVSHWWTGAKRLEDEEDFQELADIAWGSCTMCRRCTVNCPMGVDMALLVRSLRSLLLEAGHVPEGVKQVNADQYEFGNQMAVTQEDYLETLEWLNEEHAADVEDPEAVIPLDKQGADVMYVVNPREVKYAPLTLLSAAKIFYVAGENWTMPSVGWDNTNFGLFSGDDALGGHMSGQLYRQAQELGVKRVVTSECGHGYRATRWEGPNWAKMDLEFPIVNLLEVMQEYIEEGRLELDPSANKDRVTYHDPCNLGRSAGMTEEPRFVLQQCVEDFQEMYPNRADNWCCSGGGGAMSMSEYTSRRLEVAKVKADQLRETGASVVVTACHNCIDALGDCIKKYELGMKTSTVSELLADAIVMPVREPVERLPLHLPSGERPLILVVDDEPDIRTFIGTVCQDNGARVIEAADGDQALELARAELPDMITLDLEMPGRNVGEIFEIMRQDGNLADIPVCIVTGHPKLRSLIYDRPVRAPEGYVDKPVDEEKILLTARRILRLAEETAEA